MENVFSVTCVVTHTHIGHENELRCCRLRKKDREEISRKIKMGVDFDQILNDVKGSFDKEMERIHLLKKKDLHNISREFQDSSNKSKDDYEVTSALVDELEPPVEYFEAQNLDVNDFTNTPNQTIIISNIGNVFFLKQNQLRRTGYDRPASSPIGLKIGHFGLLKYKLNSKNNFIFSRMLDKKWR